jgi:L-alanine-DL-glutamate epimerase-like enolase superfamily enzyme
MALWDLLGRSRGEPVYHLLGYRRAHPKQPYASQLFGDSPEETLRRCRSAREGGFSAVKCGWGPFGRGSVKADADQLAAAREGIGAEGTLLIDAGQIWGEDVAAAEARLPLLRDVKATWLEEPFHGSAYEAYGLLAGKAGSLKLAGGEAAHNVYMARHTIDYGRVGYIQIDCGRIGGIGPAKRVADYAASKGVTYVNHTFTSHLALCASLQPYAGLADHRICEYPVTPQPMAWEMCVNHIEPDKNGEVRVPDLPGLGIEVDIPALRKYTVDTEIKAGGKTLYRTPEIA